ncbi:MAG TPA: helix-turn-helix domain-containing protein [Candidatus Saccharimonadales bacterium]|jgi:transposase
MSYSNNPNLPRARALGLKLLINEGLPSQVVANKCGVHRSTIYRWKKKWLEQNKDVQLANFDRPNRTAGKQFRQTALKWLIPTLSSRPKHSPKAIAENIVELVLKAPGDA